MMRALAAPSLQDCSICEGHPLKVLYDHVRSGCHRVGNKERCGSHRERGGSGTHTRT